MCKIYLVLLLSLVVFGCSTQQPKCLLASCPDNGRAVYQYSDGTVYDGEVLAGKAWGSGKIIDKGGNVFEGQFVRGDLSGPIQMKTQSGAVYNFIYSNNVPYGECSMILPGKVVHVMPDNSRVYLPVGVTIYGTAYIHVVTISKIEWDDGRKYLGTLDKSGRREQGTTIFSDKSQEYGKWVDTSPVILYTPEQFKGIMPVKQ